MAIRLRFLGNGFDGFLFADFAGIQSRGDDLLAADEVREQFLKHPDVFADSGNDFAGRLGRESNEHSGQSEPLPDFDADIETLQNQTYSVTEESENQRRPCYGPSWPGISKNHRQSRIHCARKQAFQRCDLHRIAR